MGKEKVGMKKIFDFIMQQKKAVLFIAILLVIQAICELLLPQYTSNIVNVGIQANGVDSVVPDCIREKQLYVIEAFLFDEDLNTVQKYYKRVDYAKLPDAKKKSYRKKYPVIEKEILYEWKGDKKTTSRIPESRI